MIGIHQFRCTSAAALVLVALVGPRSFAVNDVAGNLHILNDNGAWSWFEDERAVVDVNAGKLIVSSVASGAGSGGALRNGDIEVAALDLATNAVTSFTLHENLEADDHDSAALWIRPDGTYLASYSKHGSDTLTRFRISTGPGDISAWSGPYNFTNAAGTTYSNLHHLPNEGGANGRLYNFTRNIGFDPNILVSSDLGTTWSYGGRLLTEGTSSDRPYLRYYSDGTRIQLITTNRHPGNYDNNVYAGYVQDGKLYDSFGAEIDNILDANGLPPSSLTPIFTTGTQFNGVTMRRAWTIDVAIDGNSRPYAVFQVRANDSDLDHRFFYARFTGTQWNVHEMAKAGGYLYNSQRDYTGLAALDPSNPDRLFISTKIDPRTDVTMAHYEIFEGNTTNGGATWTWEPITFNSTVDNLRPIVPKWDATHTALLWMRGTYTTYTSYDLDIVGLTAIGPLEEFPLGDLNFDHDVTLADFELYLSGLHSNLAGLSVADAYKKGDLNGDFVNNYLDFYLFQGAYDMDNGAGSFAAMGSVPEPSIWWMLVAGGVTLSFHRRTGTWRVFPCR